MLKISTAKTNRFEGNKDVIRESKVKPLNWFKYNKKSSNDYDPIMNLFGFIGEIAVKR
jgi:hypothetical protein